MTSTEKDKTSEQYKNRFFDLSVDLLCVAGFDGYLKQVNKAYVELLGYTEEELLSRPYKDFLHEEDLQKLQKKSLTCTNLKSKKSLECRHICKKGTVKWVSWTVTIDMEENLFYAVGRDVTENKKLVQIKRELNSIVEASTDAIVVADREGYIRSWNGAAEKLFGYSQSEIIGKNIKIFVPEERKEECDDIIEKVLNNGAFEHFETIRLRKNGQRLNVFKIVTPVKDNQGKVIAIIALIRDNTEKKELENEIAHLDRLNVVAQMAAGIGHEIRNPLMTVRGFLQILGRQKSYNEDKEYFRLMIDELDRANTIITEFLAMTKKKPSNPAQGNINQVIEELMPLLQAEAINNNKWIIKKLEATEDLIFDSKEIRQMLYNLVLNGLEAMESGGKLFICTYMEGNDVVLAVRDEGIGISTEILEKLGTPFLTTKEQGTGLGLAMVFRIARQHKARVLVDTGMTGTTIYVKFPTLVSYKEKPSYCAGDLEAL
ncbi:PAS domain S-box protein [Heliorestis acidaminivorans]|uniref:histidine kinase n=1 Tax=Heliorestis acidaminivorans TaxID=553427 RepID=A0A6I0ER73_9FIRM|nr:PAS domain S-box protein [Heliorestis acidaminivorans]KAB2951976.1 PAS domain S-box protein [Heliorestis acidaminivorans]